MNSDLLDPPATPLLRRVLTASLLLLVAVSLARIAIAVPLGSNLSHESGVWTALAMDLRDGLLYRPVFGEDGYGGTRYSPLHVLIHAMGMKLGLSPIAAGLEITIASAAMLFWGVHQLLRAHRLDRPLAWIATGMLLTGASINNGMLAIRADLLPAALNVVGLALIARALRRPTAAVLAGAGTLFAMAIFAKITGIAGVVTAVVALALHRQRRDALVVAALTIVVTVGSYAIVAVASDGRFIENFRACASVSAGLAETLAGPARLWLVLRSQDPILIALLAFCIVVCVRLPRDAWTELPTVGLIVTCLTTCAIYLTPGTAGNHLVDLHAMAIVFLAVQVQRGRIELHVARLAFTVLCLAAVGLYGMRLRTDREHKIENIRSFADGLRLPFDRPIFSDSALVPIVFGQRPFVLDDYMFPIVANDRPQMRADLYERLDRREFPLVVTRWDPLGAGRARIYGEPFREHLTANYEFWEKRAGHFIYRPKK